MNVHKLTEPQLAFYREFCNFDDLEMRLFDMRSKNIPLLTCAAILNYEKIRDLSSRVNKKMIAVNDSGKMKEWIENVYWKNILNDV